MFLHINVPGYETLTVPLQGQRVTVGRHSGNNVRLSSSTVPGRLCELVKLPDGRWKLRIPRSLARLAPPPPELRPGIVVSLGPIHLRLAESASDSLEVCPSCKAPLPPMAVLCVRCGLDFRSGQRLGPEPLPAGVTPPLAPDVPDILLDEPAAHGARAAAGQSEMRGPAAAAVFGLLLLAARPVIFPVDDGVHLYALRTGLSLVLNTGYLVACVLIASYFLAIEFGEADRGVLKCLGCAALTLAVQRWLPDLIVLAFAPSGALLSVTETFAALVTLAATFVLPLLMLRTFFELDMTEVFVIVAVQWVLALGTGALLGLFG